MKYVIQCFNRAVAVDPDAKTYEPAAPRDMSACTINTEEECFEDMIKLLEASGYKQTGNEQKVRLVKFNWRYFTAEDLKKVKADTGDWVGEIRYGSVSADDGITDYTIDICYERYGANDKGFVFKVYSGSRYDVRAKYLGKIDTIHTAPSYKKFVPKAEELISELITTRQTHVQ